MRPMLSVGTPGTAITSIVALDGESARAWCPPVNRSPPARPGANLVAMIVPSLEDVQRVVGDRYEVLDLAGAGGMGAVFRARHRELGHLVAIKVLPPEVAESANRAARFKREAALAAALSHPHIVPVYEFEARADLSFLIMPDRKS